MPVISRNVPVRFTLCIRNWRLERPSRFLWGHEDTSERGKVSSAIFTFLNALCRIYFHFDSYFQKRETSDQTWIKNFYLIFAGSSMRIIRFSKSLIQVGLGIAEPNRSRDRKNRNVIQIRRESRIENCYLTFSRSSMKLITCFFSESLIQVRLGTVELNRSRDWVTWSRENARFDLDRATVGRRMHLGGE